ncbi:MAG: GyrI-like domain-containing protein [Candidatus Kapaibacterium sp.]
MSTSNGSALALYKASTKQPEFISVPTMKFLMVDGTGDPNTSPMFQDAVQALYGLAYTIKFGRKKRGEESDYKITPLEGLWWSKDPTAFANGEKSKWQWTLMLAVPDFISKHDVQLATKELQVKKDLKLLPAIRLEKFSEGQAVQFMHIGPYSSEGPNIERMHAFAQDQGYTLRGKHHEIYLGDPCRSKPERLKTILRQAVVRSKNGRFLHA